MIKKIINQIRNSSITILRKIRNGSDYKRWSKTVSLMPEWDSRTKRLGEFVLPGWSVIEFGAGRMVLKDSLPLGCSYTPSDIVDRGEGTIVCDLNHSVLPDFLPYDVAIFSGVLEYVNDVPRLIFHLSNRSNVIVASYAVTDYNNNLINRRASGWVNDLSSNEFIKIFRTAGYFLKKKERWHNQELYFFEKSIITS